MERTTDTPNTHETASVCVISGRACLPSQNTHLRLRSGDAQRTETDGTLGASRIAIATWLRHSRENASRWPSDGDFFCGAELRSNEARLSLTGLCVHKTRCKSATVNKWIAQKTHIAHRSCELTSDR